MPHFHVNIRRKIVIIINSNDNVINIHNHKKRNHNQQRSFGAASTIPSGPIAKIASVSGKHGLSATWHIRESPLPFFK
jgi:hypothetical protein